MSKPRKTRPLVASPRVGGEGPLRCWTCGCDWPSRYDLVLDTADRTLRLDDSAPAKLSKNEMHTAQVLIEAFPRWLSRSQLIDGVWDYLPDVDQPRAAGVVKSLKVLGGLLYGSRYTIERDTRRGVRLVDVDTILREENFERALAAPLIEKSFKGVFAHASDKVARAANPGRKVGPRKRGKPSPQEAVALRKGKRILMLSKKAVRKSHEVKKDLKRRKAQGKNVRSI